jgi:small conductance mechanosensitive channel
VLQRILDEEPRVLKEPAAKIMVLELADSSVNLGVRPWTMNTDWWSVKCDLIEKIKLTFDAEGINIPYPQQDVHLFPAEGQADQGAAS